MVALPPVAGLIAPEHGGRRGAFALIEQPIDVGADVVFAGFAHDACDRVSILIEDDGSGHDVARPKAVEGVGAGSGPDIEGDVVLFEEWLDFGKSFFSSLDTATKRTFCAA